MAHRLVEERVVEERAGTELCSRSQTVERRKSDRFPFSAVAELIEESSRTTLAVRIADFSRFGCYVDSLHVFPIGTAVQLSIRHAGMHFESGARVLYALTGLGMGLQFMNFSPDMDRTLQKWLAEAKGEKLPENGSDPKPDVPPLPLERQVLRRLVDLMIRKGMLGGLEGGELLEELLKH